MRVLGIETSCDETAAAVVGRDAAGKPTILSNIVRAQIEDHQEFGGVVPEIAARAHLSAVGPVIDLAARSADMELDAVDGIAVTAGPGLIGGLLVGLMTAKGLAASLGKPLIAINHLEGHALTARLTDDLAYPFLVLLVSGGHTQIVEVHGLGRYRRLATTIDDALGEAFDKTAKLLGLPFPGGPNVERAARDGDPFRFDLPRPLKGQARLDFSFSGLKTAVRLAAELLQPVTQKDIADLCASFQQAVCEVLSDRVARAIRMVSPETGAHGPNALVAAGGVAANGQIRSILKDICQQNGMKFIAPPISLCGDNGAVIGWAGLERLEAGQTSGLDWPARPRWPLDELSEPVLGHGRRGVKV